MLWHHSPGHRVGDYSGAECSCRVHMAGSTSTPHPYPRHSCITLNRNTLSLSQAIFKTVKTRMHAWHLLSHSPGHRVGDDSGAGVLAQGAHTFTRRSCTTQHRNALLTPKGVVLSFFLSETRCAPSHLVTESITTVVPGCSRRVRMTGQATPLPQTQLRHPMQEP